MKTTKTVRIGNIEARPTHNGKYLFEIVCYYPNKYYQKQDEYIECEDRPGLYQSKESDDGGSHWCVHESCFQNPQTCCTIADILNEEEPDVKCIGIRPWELNDEDKSDFEDVLKYIYENIIYPTNDD